MNCSRLSLAALLLALGCHPIEDTVFRTLRIDFQDPASVGPEDLARQTIALTLSAASEQEITVYYSVQAGSASGDDSCNGRDYSAPSGAVVFPAGTTVGAIDLSHLDDETPEPDEDLSLTLTDADGAALGPQTEHLHTITDDDRGVLLDVVKDFGARGNGLADDTNSVQEAIWRAEASERAVVFFPAGTYLVTSLVLSPLGSYAGHAATLQQAPGQPADARLLSLSFSGASDSETTRISGLVLDGNRGEQGAFEEWQFQESALLFAEASNSQAGRLRLTVENVVARNTGGSGLLLGPNTDTRVCGLTGEDVFTDFLKLSGGNSQLQATGLRGVGELGTTGLTVSGLTRGQGDSRAVTVFLEDVQLETGDLEVDVEEGSTVRASRVQMASAPFYLRAKDSSVHIYDSELVLGRPLYRNNRIVAPSDVLFERTHLILTERIEPGVLDDEADRTWTLLDVSWDDLDYAFSSLESDQLLGAETEQKLVLSDCSFTVASDVESSDTVYVLGSAEGDAPEHLLRLEGGTVDAAFDGVIAPACSACMDAR